MALQPLSSNVLTMHSIHCSFLMMMRIMFISAALFQGTNQQNLDAIETPKSYDNNYGDELLQSIQNEMKSLYERIPQLDSVDKIDEGGYWNSMAGDFRKAIRRAIDQSLSNAMTMKDELENYLKGGGSELTIESEQEGRIEFELSDDSKSFINISMVRNARFDKMTKKLKTANFWLLRNKIIGNQCSKG
jgi:hypothetical protein